MHRAALWRKGFTCRAVLGSSACHLRELCPLSQALQMRSLWSYLTFLDPKGWVGITPHHPFSFCSHQTEIPKSISGGILCKCHWQSFLWNLRPGHLEQALPQGSMLTDHPKGSTVTIHGDLPRLREQPTFLDIYFPS